MTHRVRSVLAGIALVATAVPTAVAVASAPPAATSTRATASAQPAAAPGDTVVVRRKLGESVRGRPIMAYRLGERDEQTVVLFSTMHGDEPRTRRS